MRPIALLAALAALPVLAQTEPEPEPLPDFASCMAVVVARYEQDLENLRERPETEQDFDIGDMRETEFCGTIGIVRCDRSEAPLDCQRALTAEQEALKAAILAALPAPETVTDGGFAGQVFRRAYVLSQGISAGPDCDGQSEALQAWCETREAGGAVETAILAWQAARYLDLAEPATVAGWAVPPPPTRPKARPDGLKP
ncbi:hypothetical protein [Maliponia aquimaris]|uniref:Lysozyme inhibitor LprI N-terminal domain-containing protein n=1 Tax=Maliponia aquimaris TaxID=1673631 RepID=A0A238K1L9_9RHOB|nr:hypothetical protein [Maliponia aquimaris]SMX36663.1 hypothetical protein MAA8898_00955 [Maliponia aquimaris]